MTALPAISVIGGTGHLGFGIALRLAAAGYAISIGSRSWDRSQAAAQKIRAELPDALVLGTDLQAAAREGEVVFVTVPFEAQAPTLSFLRETLGGKIVVDTTVPLVPPKIRVVQMPAKGSAAAIARATLGEGVRLVSAFQNVSAASLGKLGAEVDCDVLVTGDDADARQVVVDLAFAMGLRGIHAGGLANAVAAESLTSLLLFINKTYGAHGAGIRVTNLAAPRKGPSTTG